MKVLMVEEGARGGICQYTYSLSNALAARGVDLTLATYFDYELDSWPRQFCLEKLFRPFPESFHTKTQSRKLKLALRGIGHFPSLWRLIRFARDLKPDIIHIQWFSLNWAIDWLPFLMFKRMGIAVAFTAHDILPHDTPTILDRFALKKVHSLADKIMVHGEANRETCFQLFQTEPGKIHSIPMGNYEIANTKTGLTKKDARQLLGLSSKEKIVLFFGYIEPYKGLSYLIKAFKHLSDLEPDARLVIAGRPRGSFASYAQLIADMGLEDRVSLNLGYIPMEEVPRFFMAADVVAAPYTETYQSAVIQLAYSFATPVVATRTGGLPDLVEEGKSGHIVEPKDVESLAKGLIELFQDGDLETMGKFGQTLANTSFSWETIAATTEDYYLEILLQKKPNAARGDAPTSNSIGQVQKDN